MSLSNRPRNEYSLAAHAEMVGDPVRMAAYEAALRQAIVPGATVVDIGAGTGILSLLACKFGAARVFAIESGDAAIIGAELARANGFADRIRFIAQRSSDAELPEKVDVIVSDLHGVLPLHGMHIPSIADARRRWLKPGGALIPRRETVRVQLVSDAALYAKLTAVWGQRNDGLDLGPALRWAVNQTRKGDYAKARLVGAPQAIIELDYGSVESPDAGGEASWRLGADVVVHGVLAWFDAEMADGVVLSNAPVQPPCVYGQLFFPLAEPLTLLCGERIDVRIEARHVGEDYVWTWATALTAADGRAQRTLRQSSFEANPINPERLRRRMASHRPALTQHGQATLDALSLMKTGLSVGEIAERLCHMHPSLFDGELARAREFVGDAADGFSS